MTPSRSGRFPPASSTASVLAAGLMLFSVGCATGKSRPAAAQLPPSAAADPAQAPHRSADQLFSAGTAAYESGRYDEARSLFAEALERSPRLVGAQYNLGVIAERQGDSRQASSAYEAALQIDASHLPSILNLARLRILEGDFDKAIALLESGARQPDQKHELALMNNLAAAYRLGKKYAKAEATSRAVLSKFSDDVEALKNLALVFYEQGRFHLAELVETNAAKLRPNDPAIYNDLGLVHLKLGQRTQAVVQFRRALDLDPKFAVAHRNLGALALEFRDYPTAEKSFAALAALEPASGESHLYYAQALLGQSGRDSSKAAAAAAQFEAALAIQGNNPEAICGAGWAYSEDKEYRSKALQYLERCKGLPSTNPQERSQIEAKQRALIALSSATPGQQAQAIPGQAGSPTSQEELEAPIAAQQGRTEQGETKESAGGGQP